MDHYNIKATLDQTYNIMWRVHCVNCEPPMKVIHVSSCLYLISKDQDTHDHKCSIIIKKFHVLNHCVQLCSTEVTIDFLSKRKRKLQWIVLLFKVKKM